MHSYKWHAGYMCVFYRALVLSLSLPLLSHPFTHTHTHTHTHAPPPLLENIRYSAVRQKALDVLDKLISHLHSKNQERSAGHSILGPVYIYIYIVYYNVHSIYYAFIYVLKYNCM